MGKHRADRPDPDERGVVLLLMAVLVMVLLGVAAMAVDLGWLYWNSIEIQNGADSAALAGVLYEPDQRTEAYDEARAAARENGYRASEVRVVDFTEDPTLVEHDTQLRVTITRPVGTFFMKVFGIGPVNVRRTAVAQYTLPIALGSPGAALGADPFRDYFPGFWLSVQGTWAPKAKGDRYGAGCRGSGSGAGCSANSEHRPSLNPGQQSASGGYLYAIEVPPNAGNLGLEIFDGAWYGGDSGSNLTRDNAGDGVPTWFMLYAPDPTPLDTTDNELLCSIRFDPREGGRSDDIPGWDDSWNDWDDVDPQSLIGDLWADMQTSPLADFRNCSGSWNRGPGIYPLRIMNEHSSSDTGKNKFSLRVKTSGPAARVHGLGDMSAYALPGSGATSNIFLAEVEAKHAGKNLVVELWDVGDSSGSSGDDLSFLAGNGAGTQCSWTSSSGDSGPMGPCIIDTSHGRFNGKLLTITIPIPDTYACTGLGCWYRIDYRYAGEPRDTTTWTAYVTGDPLQLVR